MEKEDILRIQDYFVQAALRAKKAGFDGVEIHGAQLSLVSLFCSSKYNKRTDEYRAVMKIEQDLLLKFSKK